MLRFRSQVVEDGGAWTLIERVNGNLVSIKLEVPALESQGIRVVELDLRESSNPALIMVMDYVIE